MPQGAEATLPQQDPTKIQQFAQFLQRLGPDVLKVLSGGGQGQATPQGQPSTGQQQGPASQQGPNNPGNQQTFGPALQAPVPAQVQTKFDPMSNVGSLPKPVEQPGPTPYRPPSGSAEIMAKLDPKGAMQYQGIQGVTEFISNSFQKKDEKQKAEAANAAQALMSALEGAKTTGDYSPAQHILENNESLFNKVYKGWLQKSEEAKKPQKKEKPPDPDVQGFEKGLSEYLGKGAAKQPGQPQPPSTLQGRSGAKYFMPQASPQQAVSQQQTSSDMQAQRQGGQPALTEAERQKLQEGNLRIQEQQLLVHRAEIENEKAKNDVASVRAETAAKLAEAETKHQRALIDKDIAFGELRNRLIASHGAKGPKPKQMPEIDRRKWTATGQVDTLLDGVIAQKRGFNSDDVGTLAGFLTTAGASTYAKALPKGWSRWFDSVDGVKDFKETFSNYKEALKSGFDKTYPNWDGGSKEAAPQGGVSQDGTSQKGPKPGDVEGGYKFKGGDPTDQNNWEAAN